jgi:sulfonate dioxygenase
MSPSPLLMRTNGAFKLLGSLAVYITWRIPSIVQYKYRLPSMTAITAAKREQKNGQPINPFYSPSFIDDGNEQCKYAQFKVRAIPGPRNSYTWLTPIQPSFPDVSWEPLKELKVIDRGLRASSEKKSLLSAASKVITLTPTIGTELQGIDLRQLSDAQKDEL